MSGKWASRHLNGVKVEQLVSTLVDHYGWDGLAQLVSINCFKKKPSVVSSAKFLLKNKWALENIQDLYVALVTSTPTEEIAEAVAARVPKPLRAPSKKREAAPDAEGGSEAKRESKPESKSAPVKKPSPWANKPESDDPWAKARKRKE